VLAEPKHKGSTTQANFSLVDLRGVRISKYYGFKAASTQCRMFGSEH
jgi:hypothetical protein